MISVFKARALLYFGLIFSSLISSSQAKYLFNNLTNNDGLSHNTVLDLAQDSSGVMWVATFQGLNRYDSYGFKKYYKESHKGLPSNICNIVFVSYDNTLYVGTNNGLAIYDQFKDSFRELTFGSLSLPYIHCIHESVDNQILIGTGRGYYIYYPEEGRLDKAPDLTDIAITGIASRGKTGLLIGSLFNGVYYVDKDGRASNASQVDDHYRLPTDRVEVFQPDMFGNIFIGTHDEGLWKYSDSVFQKIDFAGPEIVGAERVMSLASDEDDNLWIGTEAGLFIYDLKEQRLLQRISQSLEASPYGLGDNAVHALFLSRENIMWIGTYFGGINYTMLNRPKKFQHLYPGNDEGELRGKAISSIMKSSSGHLWVGSEDGGIGVLNPDSKSVLKYYLHQGRAGLSSNNIHAITEDSLNRIWVGHFSTGIQYLDPIDETFKNVPLTIDSLGVEDRFVGSIFFDSNNQLWVGTHGGVFKYDYSLEKFFPFNRQTLFGYITDIMEDRSGRIWFCTRRHGVFSWNPNSKQLRGFKSGEEISTNMSIAAMESSDGQIWFGAIDGINIYNPLKDSFEVFPMLDELPNHTVYGLLEDDQHHIWMSTPMGLSVYNPDTRALTNYAREDGLAQQQFNYNSCFKENNGDLYFGGIGGLTYFNPSEIQLNTYPPEVLLSDFKLFNKSIEVSTDGLLKQHINQTDQITLEYAQNVFTIDFRAVNYFSEGQNQFYYYLEGFEEGWNDAGNRTDVTYTNLLPGDYTFQVKAVNKDGVQSTYTKYLKIRILNPWWLTNYAIAAYVVLMILALMIARRLIISREKGRAVLELEKMEKEQIKQLNQQRINFFTFISHEFKTPLTIIIASIDELLREVSLSPEITSGFERIKRSANRLSLLIGQLMDFRKIETRHEKIVLSKTDVIALLTNICQSFTPIISHKEIDFTFQSSLQNFECWCDIDKIEKIFTNLVSNAVNYTPEKGLITFSAEVNEGNLIVNILNTGHGSSIEELHQAFEIFAVGPNSEHNSASSGIGLALVRSMVEYLNGKISVTDGDQGRIRFIVVIPVSTSDPDSTHEAPSIVSKRAEINADSYIHQEPEVMAHQGGENQKSGQILIVEDTKDLADLLVRHFSEKYQVYYADNGVGALEIAREHELDLIISDVLMPEMDGFELCEKIKADYQLSHIPVILLTARQTHEDRLHGLRAGAIAFVAKPFDFDELDLHVHHFIDIYKNLNKSMQKHPRLELEAVGLNEKDQRFLEQLRDTVELNFSNESFTVDDMSTALGISNSLVYLKLKKLLQLSPKEYLQQVRFEKAIELICESDYTMAQIAYRTGFSDPNYFSRAFKKAHGITPSEFKASYQVR